MSIFSRKLTAIDLSYDHISTVTGHFKGSNFYLDKYIFDEFEEHSFEPNFKGFSIKNKEQISYFIRKQVEATGLKNRNISLVIPEQAIKIQILPFENFPDDRNEAKDVVIWKLKNIYGPEIENFHLSYQDFKNRKDNMDYVLVGISNQKALNEIMDIFSRMEINIIRIEVPSISIYNMFDNRLHAYGEGDFYFVTYSSNSINVMLFENFYPVFYRSTNLIKSPILIEEDIFEEIIQALRVSILYNEENRRGKVVNQIYFYGDTLKKHSVEDSLLRKLGENYIFTCLILKDEVEFLCEYKDIKHIIAPAIGILY